jgi:hypothetical protein
MLGVKRKEMMGEMSKKNFRRVSMLITAQTLGNLEKLAAMSNFREIGHVVDKLVREKMLSLHLHDDRVSVVRCKDCKYDMTSQCPMRDGFERERDPYSYANDFCSYGERR